MAEPEQPGSAHDEQFDEAIAQGEGGQAQHPSAPGDRCKHRRDHCGDREDSRQHEENRRIHRQEKPPYGARKHEPHPSVRLSGG